MNALLPFGEYVSPEQRAAEAATLETWELERLLLRLAAASQREHQRHHRSGRRTTTGSSGHRRQGSRGEASAPQPIHGGAAAAAGGSGDRWRLPGEGGGGAGGGRPASAPGPAYPSSWPPASRAEAASSSVPGGGVHDEGHVVSPQSRSTSLKSRLASLRLK